MLYRLHRLLLILCLASTGCVVRETAPANSPSSGEEGENYSGDTEAAAEPPPAPAETPHYASRPAKGTYVWVNGYWAYRYGKYHWVPGRWVRASHPNKHWVPGHWQKWGYNKYRWVPGHWSY